MRLIVVANAEKQGVRQALPILEDFLRDRAQVLAISTEKNGELDVSSADAVLSLGGDGTLLSVARRLAGASVPVMGVNFGRLGFLANFTPEALLADVERLLRGELPVQKRLVAHASVLSEGVSWTPGLPGLGAAAGARWASTALNDAVITAGPPFRMIELGIGVDRADAVRYFGDGVIVSTPSGSTAYNVSAGGPVVNWDAEVFCLTPICAHSLSFRPAVISSASTVVVKVGRVNEGTTLFCDGQAATRLHTGETVVIRRAPNDVYLYENPAYGEWRGLAEKLHWGVTPVYKSETTP